MVIGAFPIAKLAAILLRQLSKPIASYAKEKAKHHPFFRKYVCMPPAQFYNWCEIKSKMWLMNLGKPVNVPPLNENMAIELGANIFGETILFAVAAVLVIVEYNRQATKQTAKEQQQEEDMERLQQLVQELSFETHKQEVQLREMYRLVCDLNSRVIKIPWTSNVEPTEEKGSEPEANEGLLMRAISFLQNDLFEDYSNENIRKSV